MARDEDAPWSGQANYRCSFFSRGDKEELCVVSIILLVDHNSFSNKEVVIVKISLYQKVCLGQDAQNHFSFYFHLLKKKKKKKINLFFKIIMK